MVLREVLEVVSLQWVVGLGGVLERDGLLLLDELLELLELVLPRKVTWSTARASVEKTKPARLRSPFASVMP